MVDFQIDVPRYVLHSGNAPAQPVLAHQSECQTAYVIYGFSAKSKFDAFLKASVDKGLLTPYPLVKGTMQELVNAEAGQLHLVAVDATGPNQPKLDAATMESIISAMANGDPLVLISHVLRRNVADNAYRISETFHELNLNF